MLPPIFNKLRRPNLVRNDLLQKIKEVLIGVRLSGAVISRKMVISVGNGVLKANDHNTLSEFGGHITLTDDWARSILQSVDWIKRKGTTGKTEPSPKLLPEGIFIVQKSISTVAYDHDLPIDLIITIDQTPLYYVSPGKYTFNLKGTKKVPVKGADDKRQITAIFAVSATGNVLAMQLICTGKTKRYLPNVEFFPRHVHRKPLVKSIGGY